MKTAFLLFFFLMLLSTYARAQQTFNSLNVKDLNVNGNIQVVSTTESSKPCPSMTETQRDALTPAIGHCIYNNEALQLNIYDGSDWQSAGGGGIDNWLTATPYDIGSVVIESNKIYQANTGHTSGTFATDIANWTQLAHNVSDASGTLPLANGGSNKSITASNGAIAYSDTDSLELLAPGTSGQVLQANGVAAPTFVNKSISGKAQNGASVTVEEIQTSNNNLTETSANKYSIDDCGSSNNILANCGFEHTTYSTSWTTGGTATPSVNTTATYLSQGVKSLKFTASSQTFTLVQDSTLYAAGWSAGAQGVILLDLWSTHNADITICARSAGTTLSTGCYTVTASQRTGSLNTIALPIILGATSNGVSISGASGTGDTYIDKIRLSQDTLKQDIGVIGPWTSYTPTLTGVGTITSSAFLWRQVGESIEVEGTWTNGTVAASLASISLPNSYTLSTSKLSKNNTTLNPGSIVGEYTNDVASQLGSLVTATGTSVDLVYFGHIIGGTAHQTPQNASTIINTGTTVAIKFSVPIAQLANSTLIYKSSCGAECVDTLTAKISTAPAVSDLNVAGWITSVASSGTNSQVKTLTIPSGVLTVVPTCQCTVTETASTADRSCKHDIANSTTTSLVFNTSTNGAASNERFGVSCSKTGADFVASRTITGSFLPPTDEITVDTGNGHGSTNTKIRRFTNTRKNIGSCIVYADSATLGGSFTINTGCTGNYTISYSDRLTSSTEVFGITVNDSAPTTNFPLTYAQGQRALTTSVSTVPGAVSWTGYLAAGDIVRAHTNGSANSGDSQCMFTIKKVSL